LPATGGSAKKIRGLIFIDRLDMAAGERVAVQMAMPSTRRRFRNGHVQCDAAPARTDGRCRRACLAELHAAREDFLARARGSTVGLLSLAPPELCSRSMSCTRTASAKACVVRSAHGSRAYLKAIQQPKTIQQP
jgi:hypothetical protein